MAGWSERPCFWPVLAIISLPHQAYSFLVLDLKQQTKLFLPLERVEVARYKGYSLASFQYLCVSREGRERGREGPGGGAVRTRTTSPDEVHHLGRAQFLVASKQVQE